MAATVEGLVQVYLSRRNLETLLDKLDGHKAGKQTKRTIIKGDTVHKVYPQSHSSIIVTAVEDTDYYTDRLPGDVVLPEDLLDF